MAEITIDIDVERSKATEEYRRTINELESQKTAAEAHYRAVLGYLDSLNGSTAQQLKPYPDEPDDLERLRNAIRDNAESQFTIPDIHHSIPDISRSRLGRLIEELIGHELIEVVQPGRGRRATIYSVRSMDEM